MATPIYFELGWAVLSTVCLANVLFGLAVVGIVGLSPLSSVPLVVSAAGAVANGLCYYVFYADYPVLNSAVASVFGDVMWMVQEAGNVFYSFAILSRIMHGLELKVFRTLFWALMLAIVTFRALIAANRVRGILDPTLHVQHLINTCHTGYFVCIAIVECVSAFFLLRKLGSAKRSLREASLRSKIFIHLTRSTEVRVAALALIGTARAVTYCFQPAGQIASATQSQVDRFVYTFECMFPVMMFIDLLASKLASLNKILDQRVQTLPRTWTSRSERDEPQWNMDAASRAELLGRPRASSGSRNNGLGQPGKAVLSPADSAYGIEDVEEGRRRIGYGT